MQRLARKRLVLLLTALCLLLLAVRDTAIAVLPITPTYNSCVTNNTNLQ